MDDLLAMKMDQIGEPEIRLRNKEQPGHIDPFDHFEVSCDKIETLFIGNENAARAVFLESRSTAKALVRVFGSSRFVVETNAPYMYLTGKLDTPKKENKDV